MSIKYTKEEWLNQLWVDVMNGYSRYELLRRLEVDYYGWESDKWSRSKRYELLKEAYNKCKLELTEKRDDLKMVMFNRYLSIYQDSVEARDRGNALKALDSITKLSGIAEPDKVDITQDVKVSIDFGLNKDEE